jgi:hypothetical protein
VCRFGTSKGNKAEGCRKWRKRSDDQIYKQCAYVRVTCVLGMEEHRPARLASARSGSGGCNVLIRPLFLPPTY